jgi:tellurite resistance protein
MATERPPGDDVLLLHTMLLMAGADGAIDEGEISTVEAFYATLPEFEGTEFTELHAEARKLCARYDSRRASVEALAGLSTAARKRKAFVVAADVALSSGAVDATELELLEQMRAILGIDEALAASVMEVLALKYAR